MNKQLLQIAVLALSLLAIIGSAFISVTLPIDTEGIPFTAQSLMIFIVAGLSKPKYSLLIILSYLLLGVIGLPVFADGSYGWSKIIGSSGGFLYGFLVSGIVISLILDDKNTSLSRILSAMLIGTIILFGCGVSHLAFKFGWSKALEFGLYPYWKMGLVKAVLATFVVFGVKRLIQKKEYERNTSY